VTVAGWLPPDAADAMPPIALSASSTRTVFRTRWRLRGGVGVWSALVWVVVVSDMVIPYSMVSRAIVSARWLKPHGPLLGFRPRAINKVFPQDRGHSSAPEWDASRTRTSSSSTTTSDRATGRDPRRPLDFLTAVPSVFRPGSDNGIDGGAG